MRADVLVVKKDGRVERFDKNKMENAISRAGAPSLAKEIAANVEKTVSKRKQVQSSELREMAIKQLQEKDDETAKKFTGFQKAARKLSSRDDFIENRLDELVGNRGKVECVYGGFHITVTKPESFDFRGVFLELLNANQSISIEKENGHLKIITK